MSPSLSVVTGNELKTTTANTETVAERIRRLQAEARTLARDHIHALSQSMLAVERIAAEIADGGEAYPPGVRDIARRLVDDLDTRVQTLEAITARN